MVSPSYPGSVFAEPEDDGSAVRGIGDEPEGNDVAMEGRELKEADDEAEGEELD